MSTVIEITSQRTVVVDGTPRYEVVLTATPAPPIVISPTGPQGAPGPAGPTGPAGPQGPPGPVGGALEETTTFASPSAVWETPHSVPVTPSVYTYDTGDALIEGDVSYPTPSTVRVTWAWPMAGRLVVTT